MIVYIKQILHTILYRKSILEVTLDIEHADIKNFTLDISNKKSFILYREK